MTSYGAIKQHGLKGALLAKPALHWQTSGYTGEPKRFYYSAADVDHLTSTFAVIGYAIGVRPWTPYWNFGARDPLLSNIRWWEFYKVNTVPAKLVFVIIPDKPVEDAEAFSAKVLKSLNDVDTFLSIGLTLDLVKVIITKPSAYRLVEEEIDRRLKSGVPWGSLSHGGSSP